MRHQLQPRRRLRPTILCAGISVLLGACGGGTDSASHGGAADQLAASLETTAAASASNPDQLAATLETSATAAAAASGTNLALNKAATASSLESAAYPAKYAVDGNGTSRWSSQFKAAQWISIDLGAAQTINHVNLVWDGAYAKAFQIQVATNGSDWRTVYSTSTGGGGTTVITFAATTARYVKMVGIKPARYSYSLYEFQVFNDAAGNPPTAPVGNALPTDAIFAPNSFWYTAIPANAPLHSNSANLVAEFQRQYKKYYNNVTLNVDTYASPVYQPAAGTATQAVGVWDCQGKGYLDSKLAAQWASVPVASYAAAAVGTDMEMSIYQKSSDTLFEFWKMQKVNGKWQACWGGQMNNVSKSSGIWPGSYGTTATGLPFIGGQITAEELKRGEIRHAIGIALVDAERWSVVSWPAQRSDGNNTANAANRIPEGSRFRLDPAINVDALQLHPVAKIIAKAAQKYGFVVWDRAGALSVRLQNPLTYTQVGQPDPYPALLNGTARYAVLNGFPWNRLQFMPMNYGKP